MVDNRSEREGGFSLPEVGNGVARVCLISVKQTKYTENALRWFKTHKTLHAQNNLTEYQIYHY